MTASVLTNFICRPGAVFIDGVFALDTSCDSSTYLPARKLLLCFQPTSEDGGVALPFARTVDLSKGSVEPADERVKLYFFADGRAAIELNPPCIGNVDVLPYSLSQLGFSANGRALSATAYFDRRVNLVVEQPGHGSLFAMSIAEKAESVRLTVRSIGSRTYLAAEIPGISVHVIDLMDMKLALNESCVSFSWTDNAMLLRKSVLGATMEFKYTSSAALSLASCKVISAPDAQAALAALAVTSRREPALSLLAPSMRSLSAADISEFFGRFTRVLPELSKNCVALCYARSLCVYDVRAFRAELENGHICNIIELD